MAAQKSAHKSSATVSNKDALKIGLWCAIATLIISIITTRAWQDMLALGHAFIYMVIAFVAVSGVALILNWVMRNDTQNDDPNYPVLR